jgi:uncharacterized protein YukE
MDDPTVFLVEPAEPTGSLNDGYVDAFDFLSILSPSNWINQFIIEATGHDPLGAVMSWFAGDWASYGRCGEAYGHLAPCVQGIGMNIQSGAAALDQTWDGHASDAAIAYFSDLAAAVSEMQVALRTASDGYVNAARGVWQLANQAQNILQGIVDAAILGATAAAVGSSLIETGVGAVAGYGLATYQVSKIVTLIGKLLTIESSVNLILNVTFGSMLALGDQGGELNGRPLPPPFTAPVVA